MNAMTKYQEKIISEFHDKIRKHASGELMTANLFDEKIRIDKGVVEHLRGLKRYPWDEADFPFQLLDGRPGSISTSPLGLIDKETGIPEFIGFYNRGGGGFVTRSYHDAIDAYLGSMEDNNLCYLLTPESVTFDLSRTPSIRYLLKNTKPSVCVMIVAGDHNEKNDFYKDRKLIAIGDVEVRNNDVNVRMYKFDLEGNILYNERISL